MGQVVIIICLNVVLSGDAFNSFHGTAPKNSKPPENDLEEPGQDDEDDAADKGIVKLTKAERRAKLKKLKKEAKKHGKDSATPEVEVQVEVEPTPQAAVLVLSDSTSYSSYLMK